MTEKRKKPVKIRWEDYEGNYEYNTTYTNASGYFGMHIAAGILDLHFYADDYFSEHLYDFIIDPYEILWINVSLFPYPPVTVAICGYITNRETDEPIHYAYVDLDWEDEYGHWWNNYTYTNGSGFYKMGAPSGYIRIWADADGYFNDYSNLYTVNENETCWINLSLKPIPPQTAVVCGYIRDKMNGEPIENADVDLYWQDGEGNSDWNYTYSDVYGFYKMYTPPGKIRISAFKSNYDGEYSQYYWIEDDQTIWINLSLIYEPDETLIACGYILDNVTRTPVKYAYVRYDWNDEDGHMYSKYTYTDRAGLFNINVPPGSAQFYIACYGYLGFMTSWFDFNESVPITWINVSITPEITVTIEKPLPGLYVNNSLKTPFLSKILKLFIPNFKPIIIGPITIEANVTQDTSGVSRVDFYIDDIFQKTDNKEPYNFTWNKAAYFKHKITVIAYDNAGPLNIETIHIRKFS